MFENCKEALIMTLEDWNMMQKTSGDEGAEWAERFEMNFYIFIDEFEKWLLSLQVQPATLDEAENLIQVIEIQDQLPGPLQLNFSLELERIMDGVETSRFD
jgi:hypothetical protein